MGAGLAFILWFILAKYEAVAGALECEKERRHLSNPFFLRSPTVQCASNFQWEWTLSRLCCYDNYDRYYERPYCCYSEMYKMLVGVGLMCLVILGFAFFLFFCWFYNLPHHILYILTFKRFQLNEWLLKSKNNGPYVDPSFYSNMKEPFWSRDATELLTYPLRPMPPRIFYPPPPTNSKFRGWEFGGDIPLFILASRQFHRNPYSARPHDRTPAVAPSAPAIESRRNSVESERGRGGGGGWSATTRTVALPPSAKSLHRSSVVCTSASSTHRSQHQHQSHSAATPFLITVDEAEAASELKEAMKMMDSVPIPAHGHGGSWEIAELPETHSIFMTSESCAFTLPPGTQPQQRDTGNRARGGGDEGTTENCEVTDNSTSRERMSRSSRAKVSFQLMNQQLSNSFHLSLNNLPTIQVIGNFGGGRDGMETIVEDESFDEDDYLRQDSPHSGRLSVTSSAKDLTPRISSALDRTVTSSSHEIPFLPNLPGTVPDPEEDDHDEDHDHFNLERINSMSKTTRLSRRNSVV